MLAAVELVGPCRFGGWLASVTDEQAAMGLQPGDPWGIDKPSAWIQLVAVSLAQTRNTMLLFEGLFSPEAVDHFGLDLGQQRVYAHAPGGVRQIQAVTSSWKTMEGNRPTFVVLNETHHWDDSNQGHEMASVIARNLGKAKGGGARALSITNAYEPSGDSVAQRQREAWELMKSGATVDTGVLYDSLEAPESARMRPPKVSREDPEPTDEQVRAYIGAVIRAVRGDSTWLDVEEIVSQILDPDNAPSTSRRFYYNNIVAAEDAWVDPAAVRAAIDEVVAAARLIPGHDELRVGWSPVLPDEEVVMFFDGSKSDDSTALVGCRLEDGYCFLIGCWEKPREGQDRKVDADGKRRRVWQAPRGAVDTRVKEARERFTIVAFFGDPSHADDDDPESESYWGPMLDKWHREMSDDLQHWAMKSGNRTHSINFDMTWPSNQQVFVEAAEQTASDLQEVDDVEQFAPSFKIDGHPTLVRHLTNAKQALNSKWGTSMRKKHRSSNEKIDAGVCLVGARMLRRIALNKGLEEADEFADGGPLYVPAGFGRG